MPEIKAILFDVYGTLIDIKTDEHRQNIFDTLSKFLEYRQFFISVHELQELYFDHISQQLTSSREQHPEVDVTAAFAHVLKERCMVFDRHLIMQLTQLFRALSREHFQLFEDTFWTLHEFRQTFTLGIVSDAQRVFCLPELRTLRLEHFFDAIILSSDYGFRKPDPRLFRIAMSILDVSPEDTAYIGNKYETDTVGAKNADLALTGLINQNDNQQFPTEKKPDFVVKNLKQAYEVIIAQSTRVSM